MFENLADDFGVIDQRDDLHRRAALGTFQGIGLVDLVDQTRPRRPGARGSHLAALARLHRCARDQQSLHDTAQLPEQSALARKDRPQHSRYGGDVLPVRCGRKNVFLDPIPIGEHALLVTARAEIPDLARKREHVIVTAFGAIHAREPAVRVAAFEEALDDALFEQALQAPLGSQFREVAIGALIRGDSRAAYAGDTRRLWPSCLPLPRLARRILT